MEIVGGFALVVGVLLAAMAFGALVFVRARNGFFAEGGGFMLAAVSVALGLCPGEFSGSRVLGRRGMAGTRT